MVGKNADEPEDLGRKHFIMQEFGEKEKRYFAIRKKFVPNLKAASVTEKFYARHEAYDGKPPNPEYLRKIAQTFVLGPREKYEEPLLESHRYGWDTVTLLPIDKEDKLIYTAHKYTPLTLVAAEIVMATRDKPKEPPFTGVPFKL